MPMWFGTKSTMCCRSCSRSASVNAVVRVDAADLGVHLVVIADVVAVRASRLRREVRRRVDRADAELRPDTATIVARRVSGNRRGPAGGRCSTARGADAVGPRRPSQAPARRAPEDHGAGAMKRDHRRASRSTTGRLRISRKRRIFRRQQRALARPTSTRTVAVRHAAARRSTNALVPSGARRVEQRPWRRPTPTPERRRVARLKRAMIGAQAQQRAVQRERAGVIAAPAPRPIADGCSRTWLAACGSGIVPRRLARRIPETPRTPGAVPRSLV